MDLHLEPFLQLGSQLDPYNPSKSMSLDDFMPHFDLVNTQLKQVRLYTLPIDCKEGIFNCHCCISAWH